MARRYLLAEVLSVIPPLSAEGDNRGRGELGHLFRL